MKRLKITEICALLTILLITPCCLGQGKIVSENVQFSLPKSGVVKVMTFNIRTDSAFWDGPNSWNNRKNIVIDTLRNNAADVVGLQEAQNTQVEYIQQALPQYSNYSVGRKNGKQKGEACTILYREDRFGLIESGTFWFSKKPEKPGSKNWGNLFPRICSWVYLFDKTDGTTFYVYNLHLDNLSQNSRKKSVRLLASKIAARKFQDPFIVMGDFNMELDNSAMEYLQNSANQSPYPKMVDAWRYLNPGRKTIDTRHNFRGKTSGPQIDHIPICENAKALDVKVDKYKSNGRYPSDHFPVVATIHIPNIKTTSMKTWSKKTVDSATHQPGT